MSKKFEKIVNAPHKVFGRAKDKLLGWKIEGENPKIKIETKDKTVTIPVPEKEFKKGVRAAGVSVTGLGQFLFWAAKYLTLDNHLTRQLEKLFTNKKGSKKKIKHPNLVGHIVYYIMVAATVAGVDLSRDESVIKETVKEWIADLTDDDDDDRDGKTIDIISVDVKSSVKDINNTVPHLKAISTNQTKSQFVNQAIEEYWDEIAVALTELETYRAKPKLHSGEKRYTNGLGCTWQYWYNDSGVLVRSKNLANNTKTLSKDKNYEQARRHLIYETLPALYDAIKPYNNITPQMQIALLMAGYQRPADMKYIAKKLADAKTVQQVADAFADVSNVPSKWRDGTRVRRYTCALYAIGAISAEQMLDWTRDSFSMINVNTIYRNGHFVISQQNVGFLLGRSRSNTNTVREFLQDFSTGQAIVADIKTSDNKFKFDEKTKDSDAEKSMALVNKADKKFKRGNYKDAEKLYVEALALNPDNMEAYSSLALTYKMLGDEKKSEEFYQKCIDTVVKCNEYMNSNKSMLLDRRVKAMTYYNAGLARQEMGRIAQESGDASAAKEQYQLAQKNFKTAKDNAEMIDLDSDIIDIYQSAIENTKKLIDALKKMSFNASATKVKNKSDIMDLTRIKQDEYKA